MRVKKEMKLTFLVMQLFCIVVGGGGKAKYECETHSRRHSWLIFYRYYLCQNRTIPASFKDVGDFTPLTTITQLQKDVIIRLIGVQRIVSRTVVRLTLILKEQTAERVRSSISTKNAKYVCYNCTLNRVKSWYWL